jgi:hypothetical protein
VLEYEANLPLAGSSVCDVPAIELDTTRVGKFQTGDNP